MFEKTVLSGDAYCFTWTYEDQIQSPLLVYADVSQNDTYHLPFYIHDNCEVSYSVEIHSNEKKAPIILPDEREIDVPADIPGFVRLYWDLVQKRWKEKQRMLETLQPIEEIAQSVIITKQIMGKQWL